MITLVIALHNHQPVGNFDWVIEDAYQRAYRPLMELLAEFPDIRFAQHYTGILLDWYGAHHPEFLATIDRGVEAGRIELLSGGYYEPILAMLPERDRQQQIVLLNQRITEQFGAAPTGMWLAERVWEPSLPSTLHAASIAYTMLDDTHFKAAGLRDENLTGYFLTEDQGKPLAVLPIDKHLRYTMPFQSPQATIDYLATLNNEADDRVVVFADDGEKFGVWPDTYRTVYEHGWLRQFCTLLAANADWIRTVPPGEVVASRAPAGRLYLPTASYAEMLHWALPTPSAFTEFEIFERELARLGIAERFGDFVRGGFWRNFQVKYPEINAMQKKMLRVSERVERVRRQQAPGSEAANVAERAYRHLLAAQCNCPYWHGVFGGIYLANIRAAMYRQMISAEALLDDIEGVTAGVVEESDYDLDGAAELIYENREAAIYLAPARGGTIFEFDGKRTRYNFIDLLGRRPEGYHDRLRSFAAPGRPEPHGSAPVSAKPTADTSAAEAPAAKASAAQPAGTAATDAATDVAATESAAVAQAGDRPEAHSIHDIVRVKQKGLEQALQYDSYRHALLADHFFSAAPSAKELRAGTLPETGDFLDAPYSASWHRANGITRIVMRRTGSVGARPVAVEKAVSIADGSADIHVDYLIRPLDNLPLTGFFGLETAYAMSAGTEPDRYYRFNDIRPTGAQGLLNSAGETVGRDFALVDEWLGVEIRVAFSTEALLVRAPIETVSLSEDGFEKNYQGSIVLAAWAIDGATEWRMAMQQRLIEHAGTP